AHPALCPIEGIARTTAVKPLIRRTAEALVRYLARHGVGAVGGREVQVGAAADAGVAGINDFGVGKADGNMETRRAILLEIGRLANLDESIVGVLAVQGVGLEPLFPTRNP